MKNEKFVSHNRGKVQEYRSRSVVITQCSNMSKAIFFSSESNPIISAADQNYDSTFKTYFLDSKFKK